ncbi:uncharacterized protein TNCT_473471 [Trichonephila clavata]|uniref:Uncharacterized protein n=1 Tax=Trichonephila clavata TaxID=2740835 RepID=A0A8X6HMJ2_TRICU|nr:uncharacterized protein TNCT_473471 [Trichonephila clavata]
MQLPNIFLTLRQMCLSKLALHVFNDPDVRLFTSTHDVHCCIWSSEEIESLLDKESVTLLDHQQVFEFLSIGVTPTQSQIYKHRYTVDGKYHSLPNKQWEILLNQKLSTLSMPDMFRKEVTALVRLVVLESYKWLQKHKTTIEFTTNLQNHFHWTQDIKIDRQKTAKAIIADDNIDIRDRFMLAVLYCFEDDVFSLWRKSISMQQYFLCENRNYKMRTTWFPWLIHGGELDWEEYARDYTCNDFGFRTFLPELRRKKRLEYVMRLKSRNWINYHELQFCLSTLDQNQQNKVIKKCSFEILKIFLDWPLREKLLDVLELLWPYLSERNFRNILDLILCQKRLFNWIGYDYDTLLKKLWERNPFEYNKVIEKDTMYNTLKLVLEYEGSLPFPHELRVHNNDDTFIAFYSGNTVFAISKCYFSNLEITFHRLSDLKSRHNFKFFIED